VHRVVMFSLILVGGCALTHGLPGDDSDGAGAAPPRTIVPEICESAVPCNRSITIQSLSDLDEVRHCESIRGDLEYFGRAAARLGRIELPCLTSISGALTLQSAGASLRLDRSVGRLAIGHVGLASLEGLENLRSVEGSVEIWRASRLSSLRGLSNLRAVGGALTLYQNDALTNLDGLSNITTIGESLNVIGNRRLMNLDGLGNLTSVAGDLRIRTNRLLCQEEVDGFAAGVRTGGEEDLGTLDFSGPPNGWDGDC